MSDPLPPLALRHRQAQIVRNGDSSHKIEYAAHAYDILNIKGYQNCIIASKVTTIMLNG